MGPEHALCHDADEWDVDHREAADASEPDLGTCPYFARYWGHKGHDPEAVCAFGCRDEPECVTCRPTGGWPSERAPHSAASQGSRP